MYRTDADGFDATANGVGKAGYRVGDPLTPTPSTVIDPAHLNTIQEELAGLVESSGMALSKSNKAQLQAALLDPLNTVRRLVMRSWRFCQMTAAGGAFVKCAWSPTLQLFAAVGWSGTNRIATSPDGINWTVRTITNRSWYGIVWADTLGLFVAVDSNNARVVTSSDGITWTITDVTGGLAAGHLKVAWSSALGLLAGVGGATTQRIATSADGTTWTPRTTPNSSYEDICWSPELGMFLAVGGGGAAANGFMTSTNGTSWTGQTSPGVTIVDSWYRCCWSSKLRKFVVLGTKAAGGVIVAVSSDGTNWTVTNNITGVTGDSAATPTDIVSAEDLGMFIASHGTKILWSIDGTTWNTIAIGGSGGVCWSPLLGRAVLARGRNSLYTLLGDDQNLILGSTVQESIIAAGSVGSWSTGTDKNVGQLTLQPGEYEVTGAVTFAAAAITGTQSAAKLSTVTNNAGSPADEGRFDTPSVPTAAAAVTCPCPPRRVVVEAANTIVYLVGRITFSGGTPTAGGYIRARRITGA